VTLRAAFLIESHNHPRQLGHVLTNEAGVIVTRRPDTVRGVDVAFISYDRLPKDAVVTGFLEQAPELVIEVLSSDTSWGAMEKKIGEYHEAGVDSVWVLDPQTLTLRAYRRDRSPILRRDSETVDGPACLQGFSCRVAEFFSV
jgi:Uma2 family endonuclease